MFSAVVAYGQQPATSSKPLIEYTLAELKQKRSEAFAAKENSDVAVYDAAIQMRTELDAALKVEDFEKAAQLKGKLTALKIGQLSGRAKELNEEIKKAVAAEDFEKANALKKELDALTNGTAVAKDTTGQKAPAPAAKLPVLAPVVKDKLPVLAPQAPKVIVVDTFQYKRMGWMAAFGMGAYSLFTPSEFYSYGEGSPLYICPTVEIGLRYRKRKIAYGMVVRAGTGLSSSTAIYSSTYGGDVANPPDGDYSISYDVTNTVKSLYGIRFELSSPLYSQKKMKFHYAVGIGVEKQNTRSEFTNGQSEFNYGQLYTAKSFSFDFPGNVALGDVSFGPAIRLGKNRLSPHLVLGVGVSVYVGSTEDEGVYNRNAARVFIGIRK